VLLAAAPAGGRGYDPAEPGAGNTYQDFGHSHRHNSLIWGEGLHDVSITRPGRIDGRALRTDQTPIAGSGNKAIALKLCRNVVIRDLTMVNGGHFCLLASGVDDLTVDNLLIDTNRDGMDIDCCRTSASRTAR
jgi:polygalacturonase